MLRISIYHWLPIADNMLPQIESALQKLSNNELVSDVDRDEDSIKYKVQIDLMDTENNIIEKYPAKGIINQRGFSQNNLELPFIEGISLQAILNIWIPRFEKLVIDFLFQIVPLAVKNKLAVLNEGLFSLFDFQTRKFDPIIDNQAKEFLRNKYVISIMIDNKYKDFLKMPFSLPYLNLNFDISDKNIEKFAKPSKTDDESEKSKIGFFYYSNIYNQDELIISSNNIIYKYCAIINFVKFIEHVITILKNTRDHIVPIRRHIAIALQRNTEEHYETFQSMKKYLSYIDIKLPIIQKIINHITDAINSPQFRQKIETLSSADFNYFTKLMIDEKDFRIDKLVERLAEDFPRLNKLNEEDFKEVSILSNELTQVIDGSLMFESKDILSRELDASQATLELDRTNKNRSNALKVLSIVLSAQLGALIADSLGYKDRDKLYISLAIMFSAWFLIEYYIRRKNSYFRLVIPINDSVPRESLEQLIDKSILIRQESNGQRRNQTWYVNDIKNIEKVRHNRRKSIMYFLNRFILRIFKFNAFLMTVDYEKRGYIHQIIIEKEYGRFKFNKHDIITAVIYKLYLAGCLNSNDIEKSLLTKVLSSVNINLRNNLVKDSNLTSLNKLLNTPTQILEYYFDVKGSEQSGISLSEEDSNFVSNVKDHLREYSDFLTSLKTNKRSKRLVELIGLDNIERKKDFIEDLRIKYNKYYGQE
jgi:hypothetical protein